MAKQGSALELPGRWRSPPVPVVMPGAVAQPSPSSSRPEDSPWALRGWERTALPLRGPPQHLRPTGAPRRSRAACTRQLGQPATYLGGPEKLCWHQPAPAQVTPPASATCAAPQPPAPYPCKLGGTPPLPLDFSHLRSHPGEADLAVSVLRMEGPRTDG